MDIERPGHLGSVGVASLTKCLALTRVFPQPPAMLLTFIQSISSRQYIP